MAGKQMWPGWETLDMIGSGGFSKVYRIRKDDSNGDFYSALKVISIPRDTGEYQAYLADGYDDASITRIFKSQVDELVKEFQLMSRFRGTTNIVSYEDHRIVAKEDGVGWDVLIRMELLTALPDYYKKSPLEERDVVRLGMDICRALTLCEKANIVHRDIKPSNIFVNAFGDFKLGDFGVARAMDHTTHATKIGTYSYMAPEIYRGDAYNNSADIYSLGLVLYWLLNERRLPFVPMPPAIPSSVQINDAQAKRLSGDILQGPKHGSKALKQVVMTACAHNPKDRYASAEQMGRALSVVYQNMTDSGAIYDEAVTPIPEEKTEALFRRKDDETVTLDTEEIEDTQLLYEEAGEESNSFEKERRKLLVRWLVVLPLMVVVGILVILLAFEQDIEEPLFGNNKQTLFEGVLHNTEDVDATESSAVVSMKVSSMPEQTTYYIGETFNPTGMTIELTCSDGSTRYMFYPPVHSQGVVQQSWNSALVNYSPLYFQRAGKQAVMIREGNQYTTVWVTVLDVEPVSLTVKNKPLKTKYNTGELFNFLGMTLEATYPDGKKTTISSGFICSPASSTKEGEQMVKVQYAGKETTVRIMVGEVTPESTLNQKNKINSVTIFSKPDKTQYYMGDTLDTTGLSLKVIYSDGTEKIVKTGFSCSPTKLINTVPYPTIRVDYAGYKTSFTVQVQKKEAVWRLSGDTLIIFGDGPLKSYGYERIADGVEKVIIEEGVTSIGNCAFYKCNALTSVTIPESVTSIGDSAFRGCDALTSITVPEGVTSIGDGAFSYCSALTSITIPEGVTSIGDSAFRGCDALTSITIPEGVTSIGDSAFSYCRALTSITIPEGVTSIGNHAFRGCDALTSITVPEGVTSIGDYAFCGCEALKSITVPEGVTSIGDYAFCGCDALTSITVPEGVTSIGNYAFYYCNALTSITIPEGVTSIGDYTFSYCDALTSITIPEGVTSIGDGAFRGCDALTSITVPDSVTSMGASAIRYCVRKITLFYGGTKGQWNALVSANGWSGGDGGCVVKCRDGEISYADGEISYAPDA